jgi:hypothetical protein
MMPQMRLSQSMGHVASFYGKLLFKKITAVNRAVTLLFVRNQNGNVAQYSLASAGWRSVCETS